MELATAAAKYEQLQAEETIIIKRTIYETSLCLHLLKYLLHFNMVQMSKSPEDNVSPEASTLSFQRHELREHYEKL